MTKTSIAQTEPVLVAVDIAKARHEVLIAIPGRTRRRLTVLNQLDDFSRLIGTLSDYGRPVRVAFEATGNYHRALAYRLGVAGFEVKLVSSVALARTREALNNSWDKNDPKDAQVRRLSLAFSSSIDLNFATSDTSMPPYFDLYL